MEADLPVVENISQENTPTPEELQKQSPDTDIGQDAGQLEADVQTDVGMIDGETDAEIDLN